MYGPKEGLVRGTLFPGLDLPFMGMVNQEPRDFSPLMQLQSMAFGLQELALYLDTHREDKEALEVFQSYRQMYLDAKKAYEQENGPLTLTSVDSDRYNWLENPWPWEYTCNGRE